MKKMIAMIIAIICIVFLLAGCGAKSAMTGRFLAAENGACLIVNTGGSPILMRNLSGKEGLFAGLETGDKIKITHDGINESYPGQTGVYRLRVVRRGSLSDIPEKTLNGLRALGWELETE